jgi:hypothetical protein
LNPKTTANFRGGLEAFDQKSKKFGQKSEEFFNRFDGLWKTFENGFDWMSARMRNSHSYRAHDQVAVLNHCLQKPDKNRFPNTIKEFWELQYPGNGKLNSSPRTGVLSLTMNQLPICPICCNSTLLNGSERIRRLSLSGTQVTIQTKAQLLRT